MISPKNMDRKKFMHQSALAGLAGALGLATSEKAVAQSSPSMNDKISGSNKTRFLGKLEVSPQGLGCMSMTSKSYNPVRRKEDMIPVIRGAFDRGVTFFDTAEVYGPFTNEEYVGEALVPIRNKVILASKLGFSFEEGGRNGRDSRPQNMRRALEGMLKRLRTDRIDLLYLHRKDPNVPIEDVAGTMKEFIQQGKIRYYGLSEVSLDNVRMAHAVHPVSALQNEYSIIERVHENGSLQLCEELGIGFVPWCPVVRGFMSDRYNEFTRFSEDSRFVAVPYFTPEAIKQHMQVLDLVRDWSVKKNITPIQFSLAWLMAQKPFIVPIPGTTRLHHLQENLGANNVQLTADELSAFRKELEKIPLIGVRKPDSILQDM